MKLSKYEKETIILTNEEDQYYSVYTFNQGLQKRLKNFAERYPEMLLSKQLNKRRK